MAEDPVPRKDESSEGQMLKLILSTVSGLSERIVEMRIDLAKMQTTVTQLQQAQSDEKTLRKDAVDLARSDLLLTAAGVSDTQAHNDQVHADLWLAINKLSETQARLVTWGRTIAILGTSTIILLSVFAFITEFTHAG
jgi:hypothetical protein